MIKENDQRGDTLLSLCKDKGFNLKDLAKISGIAYSTLRKYSRGEVIPPIDKFALICSGLNESPKTVLKALGVDVSKIPNDED